MQEFFYTILAIWLVWRIFSAFSRSSEKKASANYTQNNTNHYNTPRPGDVRVEEVKKEKHNRNSSDDDYVDFEEIK